MTEPEPSESDELLKADVLGRVRVRPEHRERMLDAFEASAMSGQAFAIHHGIKVQTFASWLQKRRRNRGDYDDEGTRQRLRMPAKPKASGQPAFTRVLDRSQDRLGRDSGYSLGSTPAPGVGGGAPPPPELVTSYAYMCHSRFIGSLRRSPLA